MKKVTYETYTIEEDHEGVFSRKLSEALSNGYTILSSGIREDGHFYRYNTYWAIVQKEIHPFDFNEEYSKLIEENEKKEVKNDISKYRP